MTLEKKSYEILDLDNDGLIRLAGMFLGHVITHYGIWFTQAVLRFGVADTVTMEEKVARRHFEIAMARLAPHFNIETRDGLPAILFNKSREELLLLISDLAKTWVTGDGLWFQSIEDPHGMAMAKAVNDSCWSIFARLEAYKIKSFLGPEDKDSLSYLEQALKLRIYSSINSHSVKRDEDGSLIFSMTECRVQSARRRKEMDDYPCKSAGLTEYTEFALGIDPNIVTECLHCPPDRASDQDFCAWRFSLKR
ncbi:MAG: DUF6125 family protein [Desulfomonilaceae bacterium]